MRAIEKTYLIEIKGLVQGVGFRPFIFRLAKELKLSGWVSNTNQGVKIGVRTSLESLSLFLKRIEHEAPPASDIYSVHHQEVAQEDYAEFVIRESEDTSDQVTEVSPDIAVCTDCLNDMHSQPHRINYPFLNCTNCGPRFTIIQDLPYDREKTTMSSFTMCNDCRSEYEDVLDRRFQDVPLGINSGI